MKRDTVGDIELQKFVRVICRMEKGLRSWFYYKRKMGIWKEEGKMQKGEMKWLAGSSQISASREASHSTARKRDEGRLHREVSLALLTWKGLSVDNFSKSLPIRKITKRSFGLFISKKPIKSYHRAEPNANLFTRRKTRKFYFLYKKLKIFHYK